MVGRDHLVHPPSEHLIPVAPPPYAVFCVKSSGKTTVATFCKYNMGCPLVFKFQINDESFFQVSMSCCNYWDILLF
jgi:hypothetical protein